ncbi:GDSL-type esterase/lipase family protein [Mesomycoplasma ovipneumoniae]|uniref:GDSL-type esterase/lipase family protein n=1 Tax=Mesomycoplasma ovipneumoniae TaxID=29562 RepID=A0AAW6Q992_9BACT|nr:GDSL-type esterase/lipase family protein [Mesomycoplasma ovipneumoniae]MDF9627973.1 GDSL-type esterase/lipase family protein [Mesomycoplasma ovipneumoniae]MDO4157990.1 GDSL-type esterase/lipase family protein [Mesomycoplasma ovipneumoniae]MDO4158165.1 GDSL-type esterase/lipase family protein [Mesomycoplasma ovipneumoniae]MDO6821832.1 GDSL-type esterase/lipase family protein [Mesomycoplasma ovipneumoniae]MDO6855672.1 GDSL-type esterase/lipase family protein [Mesomycoplasma ovipneumoniae]
MKYKNVQNYPVRKRLKLISLGLLPIATAVTFVACVSQDSAKLQSFKYLAIGDSVTAGFNQETYRDFQGKLNSQGGGVSGLSYPSFFAHYLQKLNKDSLVSYDNLAFSGATVKNWLNLINPTKYTTGKVADNPFVPKNNDQNTKFNDLSTVFGNFNKSSYPELTQKIKNANLLTMTLGANDIFLVATKFGSLLSPETSGIKEELDKITVESAPATTQETAPADGKKDTKEKEDLKPKIAKYIKNEISTKITEFKADLENLLKELKTINPNLHINLLPYKLPNSLLVQVLSNLFSNDFGLEKDYFQKVTTEINTAIRQTAQKASVNYVDPFDSDIWNDSDTKLGATQFDIHPQVKGYKKIAEQLLLKLATNQSQAGDVVDNIKKSTKFTDNASGNLTYKHVLDLSSVAKTNEELLKKINDNKSETDFIYEESEFEKSQASLVKDDKKDLVDSMISVLSSNIFGKLDFKDLVAKSGNFYSSILVNLIPESASEKSLAEILKTLGEFATPFLKKPGTDIVKAALNRALTDLEKKVKDPKNHSKITFPSIINSIISGFVLNINISKALAKLPEILANQSSTSTTNSTPSTSGNSTSRS